MKARRKAVHPLVSVVGSLAQPRAISAGGAGIGISAVVSEHRVDRDRRRIARRLAAADTGNPPRMSAFLAPVHGARKSGRARDAERGQSASRRATTSTVLNSDDCFEPSADRRDDGGSRRDGRRLGFSAVSSHRCKRSAGQVTPRMRASWIAGAGDLVRESDTVGSAPPGESNVAVSTGNLFLSRKLFDLLDGFGNHRYNHDWDFACGRVWRSEPRFAPWPLYRYRVHANNTIRERSLRSGGSFEHAVRLPFGRIDPAADQSTGAVPPQPRHSLRRPPPRDGRR